MPARSNFLSTFFFLGFCSFTASVLHAQPYVFVANAGSDTLAVVNLGTNSVSGSVTVQVGPGGVAVTPNGATAYVSSTNNNNVSVVNTASLSVVATVGVGSSPTQLAMSPDGSAVYVVDQGSNQVSVIATSSNSVVGTINVGSHPAAVRFSADGTRAYVANMWSNNLSVIDTGQRAVINTFATQSGPSAIAVGSNGRVYVANQGSASVTVYDGNGNAITTINNLTSPTSLAITPNSTKLLVTNENLNAVTVIDTGSNSPITQIPVGMLPSSVAISADGSQAFVTNLFAFSLSVINMGSYAVTNTIPGLGVFPIAVTVPWPASAPPPPPQTCSFAFSQNFLSVGAGAYTGAVNVIAPSGCAWSVTSNNTTYLSVTSGASGSGNGSVSFSVPANTTTSLRQYSLSLNGAATFTVTQSGNGFSPIRINCGGPSFTDPNGNAWQADTGRNYSVTSAQIQGADIPSIYQKEAFAAGGGLSYQFNVPNGNVTVKLRFAEIYITQPGGRVVNLIINGNPVMSNFDILAHTSPNSAYDLTFPTSVTNGQVSIQVVPVTGTAKLAGIEIY